MTSPTHVPRIDPIDQNGRQNGSKPSIPLVEHIGESGEYDSLPFIETRPHPSPCATAAFCGLAGEFVKAVEPHSEADPVALLTQFLAAFGNVIGRSAHFRAEADEHYANLFVNLVGKTSKGRKSSSWGHVKKRFAAVDSSWAESRIPGGLSSGEGLIYAVRDQVTRREPVRGESGKYGEVVVDAGESDKRLLIYESEFSNALSVMRREGNTLSAQVRQAWDTGNLRTLTKSPMAATGAHVSIIGNITNRELLHLIDDNQVANGFANRFLWISVKRSKLLPEGGATNAICWSEFDERLLAAVAFGRRANELKRDDLAREMWIEVYPELSYGRPGLLGAVTSRAEAQVMRLALIYALLDCSEIITQQHLKAALSLWRYAEISSEYIFGDVLGDPIADQILAVLRERKSEGMTRTEINSHFQRNVRSSKLAASLTFLLQNDLIREQREQRSNTGGRRTQRFFAMDSESK